MPVHLPPPLTLCPRQRPQNGLGLAGLEALSVDDGRTRFVVFLFGDPHLLIGGEGSENRASDPDRVFTFGGSNDFDFHGGGGEGVDFFLHSVGDTGVHGRSARHDDVAVEILADVDVAFHDRVVRGLVDTGGFLSEDGGLEQGFGCAETTCQYLNPEFPV